MIKNFEKSASVFRKASIRSGALLCLVAVAIFTLPVGAQRGAGKGEQPFKSSKVSTVSAAKQARIAADEASYDGSESLAPMVPQAPLVNPVIYAYDQLNDRLISFNAATPGTLLTNVALTGLDTANNEVIEFIDFRPANGVLYAVANKDGFPNRISRVVTINLATGAVSSVGGSIPSITNDLTFYGGDFNSVVDRIREVDTANANRRLNPNDGTVTANDTPLAYATGDPFFGTVPRVSHVAYINNIAGAAGPTLYGIDNATDRLVRIGSPGGTPVSPDSGQLFTIGPLGVDVGNFGGFDIQPGTGLAFAALRTPGTSSLYSINLSTGAASLIGSFDNDNTEFFPIIDGLSIVPGAASTDLSITKTDGFTTYAPGAFVRYTVVATNGGPDPVVGATVIDNFSASFSSASFTCVGSGGGTCPASGTGNINALVDLPVGASVTFSITAIVSANATGNLVNTATITAPAGVTDSTPGNNSATDTNTLTTTSAGVLVSGRVMAPSGRGLRGARVTIVDSDGVATSVVTSSLGYYTFDDVAAGGTYVISVGSRQFRFDSRIIQVSDNLTDVDFMGIE
ncbi:hypothetical protein BH20ACI2_BH20ACI2_10630 [soil metagenome]